MNSIFANQKKIHKISIPRWAKSRWRHNRPKAFKSWSKTSSKANPWAIDEIVYSDPILPSVLFASTTHTHKLFATANYKTNQPLSDRYW